MNEYEWAGKEMENESGHLTYTRIHAWTGDVALCGQREPKGQWVSEHDSPQSRCKRCEKRAA